jgi:MFS family permease
MIVAVLPLAAEDLLGSARWSGAPSALGTTGVAFGATWLATLTVRYGRRRALSFGYWAAAAAAGVAAFGAATDAFVLLAASIFILGAGYSSSRLSRYAAADLYEPSQRSAAIGWNVWAATIGSVAGPLLLGATRRGSLAVDLPEAAGPFLVAALAFAGSGLAVQLLFAPEMLVTRARQIEGGAPAPRDVTSIAGLRLATAALVVGQVVMVLIMTMTPLHIRHGGEGLDTVGIVFASHTFGMFAFSPLAGVLSDRLGRVPMIVAGSVSLSASGLLAAISPAGSMRLVLALFLLGLGWCLSFVAGSALLTESVSAERRVRTQGVTDSLIWGSAAAAGLASGFLLSAVGYTRLSHVGAVLALAPLLLLLPVRRPY